ncbi:hypothetical protein QUF72_21020 [Desulfobacterales bacterium HSG2]|nr:hypothetical protein [Desulfobacterales bacterium HSG2]
MDLAIRAEQTGCSRRITKSGGKRSGSPCFRRRRLGFSNPSRAGRGAVVGLDLAIRAEQAGLCRLGFSNPSEQGRGCRLGFSNPSEQAGLPPDC